MRPPIVEGSIPARAGEPQPHLHLQIIGGVYPRACGGTRKRRSYGDNTKGLSLLSWVSTPEELDPSQNRVEEFFLRRLLYHLPNNIRPLLLADRGFGRASLVKFLQEMPHHTGYTVDYVIRLRGDVVVQSADYRGRLRDYPLRKGQINFWPQTLYRSDGAVVINLVLYWARGHREPWYLATSLADPRKAVRMYLTADCSRSSISRTASNASG